MIWNILKSNKKLRNELSKKLHISPILAQVLINRGLDEVGKAKSFFNPTLKDLHDPFTMKGMKRAVGRIIRAIAGGEKIGLYGDYDVDGVTATSILCNFFESIGYQVYYYIPNRESEGYGLNIKAVDMFRERGISLMITLDCGTTDVEEIRHARRNRMDVIVSDHHSLGDTLPYALAILNPKQGDCTFPYKELSGVGVAFNLLMALRSKLVEEGYFGDNAPPNLKSYLDLVALGTVADVVPLIDENRIFVKYGIKELETGERLGIQYLKTIGGVGESINTNVIGFQLAPRINVAGRLSEASVAVKMFTTDDPVEAFGIAKTLNKENQRRKYIEEKIYNEAVDMIEKAYVPTGMSIVLASEGWHPGVIGIVASRIAEIYYRPTVIISLEDGQGKGSSRSIPGFDILSALNSCRPYLVSLGGHKFAAGLKLEEDMLDKFRSNFEDVVSSRLSKKDLVPSLNVDLELGLDDISDELIKEIKMLEPFGRGNPRPVFAARNVNTINPLVLKEKHIKFRVEQKGSTLDVIGFGMASKFNSLKGKIDLAFTPEFNFWQGKKEIRLSLKDVKESKGD